MSKSGVEGSQGGVDTLDGVSKSVVDAMDGSQGGVGLFDRSTSRIFVRLLYFLLIIPRTSSYV